MPNREKSGNPPKAGAHGRLVGQIAQVSANSEKCIRHERLMKNPLNRGVGHYRCNRRETLGGTVRRHLEMTRGPPVAFTSLVRPPGYGELGEYSLPVRSASRKTG
jgi:hypothetical protein